MNPIFFHEMFHFDAKMTYKLLVKNTFNVAQLKNT
jgi:hypothetical protein